MSEETTNQTAEPAVEPVETPTTESFSQEQVNEMVQKRLARDRKKHEAEMAELQAKLEKATAKPKSKPQQKPAGVPDEVIETMSALKAEVESLKSERTQESVDRAFKEYMDAKGVDADMRPLLRGSFDPASPEKLDPLVAKLTKTETAPAPEPTFNSPGAPNANSVATVTNPAQWTKDDVARFRAAGTLRENFEKYFSNMSGGNPHPFPARRRKKG